MTGITSKSIIVIALLTISSTASPSQKEIFRLFASHNEDVRASHQYVLAKSTAAGLRLTKTNHYVSTYAAMMDSMVMANGGTPDAQGWIFRSRDTIIYRDNGAMSELISSSSPYNWNAESIMSIDSLLYVNNELHETINCKLDKGNVMWKGRSVYAYSADSLSCVRFHYCWNDASGIWEIAGKDSVVNNSDTTYNNIGNIENDIFDNIEFYWFDYDTATSVYVLRETYRQIDSLSTNNKIVLECRKIDENEDTLESRYTYYLDTRGNDSLEVGGCYDTASKSWNDDSLQIGYKRHYDAENNNTVTIQSYAISPFENWIEMYKDVNIYVSPYQNIATPVRSNNGKEYNALCKMSGGVLYASEITKIDIINASGRICRSINQNKSSSVSLMNHCRSISLASGAYVARITCKQGVFTMPFILN